MIGIITRQHNNIIEVLDKNFIEYEIINEHFRNLHDYKAILVLGGTEEEPLKLEPRQRLLLDAYIASGKKVFVEYMVGIGAYTTDGYVNARYERVANISQEIKGYDQHHIIDIHATFRLVPFGEVLEERKVLAAYTKDHAHSFLYDDMRKEKVPVEDYALFFEKDNVLVSSFQLANYRQNRYAPFAKVDALVSWILTWALDQEIDASILAKPYQLNGRDDNLEAVVKSSIAWFDNADILINGGKGGVYEGYGTEVYVDGTQRFASNVRGDCVGEASWLYYLAADYFDEKDYKTISDNLMSVALEDFTVQEGFHKGFVRWSDAAFESNYGDDVARMIMPILFKNLMGDQDKAQIETLEAILDFHLKTTGKDGLRRGRFEIEEVNENNIKAIQNETDRTTSAHYNAYYHAVLILGYQLIGKEAYLEMGLKGLDNLLNRYPNTKREQSQTQEEARLILPVSIAYWVTKEEKYKSALEMIVNDMKKRSHPTGAYLEWDEGYKASMRHTLGEGECSLLSRNGDSVVDLLYTNNWLPFGFAMAYIATEDEQYKKDLEATVSFLAQIQMKSDIPYLDGVWARGFDPELMEYFGSPADKGWGPYCIESGWTVSQISSGILLSLMLDEFANKINKGA
ncbi:MAG TPA: hypothetical protein VIG45_00440 [Erysipelothrix sp.]